MLGRGTSSTWEYLSTEVMGVEEWRWGKRGDCAATVTLGVGRGLTDPFGDVSSSPDAGEDVSRTLVSSVSCTGFETFSPLRALEIDKQFKTRSQVNDNNEIFIDLTELGALYKFKL